MRQTILMMKKLGMLAPLSAAFLLPLSGVSAASLAATSLGATIDATGSAETDLGTSAAVVQVSRDDAEHSLPVMNATADFGSSRVVGTTDDLHTFAMANLESDARLHSMSFTSSDVSVSREVDGRLLGLFPVRVETTVNVDAAGHVTMSYPWYAFLVSRNDADVSTRIEDRLKADGVAQDQGSLTPAMQAQVAADVQSVLADDSSGE